MSLFEGLKDSKKWYIADLEAKKSIERKEEVKKKELVATKKDEAIKIQLSVLQGSLGQLQNSLTVAGYSVKEGNEQP